MKPLAEMPTRPRAVTYLRVSTAQQAEKDGDPEGYSIPAQREANIRKAESLGADVVEIFVDRGESARSADRPELQRMLKYVRENAIAYCIVHKVDRLARSRADDVQINMALKAAGVTLVSATENFDETPSGMLLHGVMSSIAEFYSRNLANEVMKGMVQKAKTGGTPGRAPVGYRNQGVLTDDGREVRTVIRDEKRAPLIRDAFVAYATGEWTLQGLVDELTLRGLTSRPTPARPARPLTTTQLHRILTNPYYTGVVTFQGVTYEGRHEPIIDGVTWSRVQNVLALHLVGEKVRTHDHYLKGSIFCGRCHSRMIVQHAVNRHGTAYNYYMCSGRHERRNGCDQSSIPTDVIEERVMRLYQAIEFSPELRDDVEKALRETMSSTVEESNKIRHSLLLEKSRLDARAKKLLDGHLDGIIPADLYAAEQRSITSNLIAIAERVLSNSSSLQDIELNLQTALDLIENCYEAYLRAPDFVRRAFNQAFFERVEVDWSGEVVGQLAEPFALIVDAAGVEAEVPAGQPEVTKQITLGTREKAQGLRDEHLVRQTGKLSNLTTPVKQLFERYRHGEITRLMGDVPRPIAATQRGRHRRLSPCRRSLKSRPVLLFEN